MLFNTLEYACFLLATAVVHALLPRRGQPWLLLLASYLFYARWSAAFLPLILGLTAVNYVIGLGLSRSGEPARTRSALLAAGVGLNLAVLACFKYTGFLLPGSSLSPVIPLGLSFFVFEFIHYLVDVRRGQPPLRSPLRFALFAAFFPTQIAGPIKRYEQFVPQIDRRPPLDRGRVAGGLRLLLAGLFKKVALADNLAPIVAAGFPAVGSAALGALDAWLVALAFALQIYFDFSGYTDMGRGSAALLGYDVPENFRRPYLSTNVAEFWRRWHISLSSWLRDYLYVPLGGGRSSRYRNLFVTMVLGGLWHGANWTFVAWGALHGVLLVLYRWRSWPWVPAVIGWAFTMAAVCAAWVLFRAASLPQALAVLAAMGGAHSPGQALLWSERWFVAVVAAGCVAVELVIEHRERIEAGVTGIRGGRFWIAGARVLRPALYVLLIVLTLVMKPEGEPPFIYFRF